MYQKTQDLQEPIPFHFELGQELLAFQRGIFKCIQIFQLNKFLIKIRSDFDPIFFTNYL